MTAKKIVSEKISFILFKVVLFEGGLRNCFEDKKDFFLALRQFLVFACPHQDR